MGVITVDGKGSATTLQAGTVCCGTLAHLWVLRACSRHSIAQQVVSWECHSDI